MSAQDQFGSRKWQPGGGRPAKRPGRWFGWVLLPLLLAWGAQSGSLNAQSQADHERAEPEARRQQAQRSAEVPPPPPGMSYVTRVDRTAIWVGDQFHYVISVEHSPNYEFVLENLTRETLNMEPFQMVEVRKETVTLRGGNKRLTLDITLAGYFVGQTTEQIPQITLFYFRRDQQTTTAPEAAAESLTIPGPIMGVRTTLTPGINDIRDAVTVTSWARSRWGLAATGMLALAVLVAGLGWETAVYVKKRKSRKGPDRRKAMEAVRGRWASAVPADFEDPLRVMEFYNQSYRDVKEYVGYYLELPTLGLTAEELQAEMQRLGASPEFTQKVVGIVDMLETVRYSSNGLAPTLDSARRTAQQIREIFTWGAKR